MTTNLNNLKLITVPILNNFDSLYCYHFKTETKSTSEDRGSDGDADNEDDDDSSDDEMTPLPVSLYHRRI